MALSTITDPPPIELSTGTRSQIVSSRTAFWNWIRDYRSWMAEAVPWMTTQVNTTTDNANTATSKATIATEQATIATTRADEILDYIIPTDVAWTVQQSVDSANSKVNKVTSTDNSVVRFNGTSGEVQNSEMIILDNSNVGIGTTSPDAKLDVRGTMLFGSGRFPTTNASLAGERFAFSTTANQGYGFFQSIPPTVSENDKYTLNIGATQSDNGTNFAGANIIGGRENAISGDGSGYLTFGTSITGNNPMERIRINSTGNVGIGTNDPSVKLEVNGYTKLGSDAPAIKYKKINGTTASTEGGSVTITHGLTPSKIISYFLNIEYNPSGGVPSGFSGLNGYESSIRKDTSSSFIISNMAGNSSGILSKPFTVLITYEE